MHLPWLFSRLDHENSLDQSRISQISWSQVLRILWSPSWEIHISILKQFDRPGDLLGGGERADGMCFEVEDAEDMSQGAGEQDVFCTEDTPSSNDNEGGFPAELSGNGDPVEEPDEIDTGDESNGQLHDADGSKSEDTEDGDFANFFKKLGQETLPHQAATKAEAFLLVLTHIVSAGLTWTHSGVLKAMVQAVCQKKAVFGIKGPSTLVKLQGFDLVWGLFPEYMHCVLEGITKQVTEMWLSAIDSSCYIGRNLKLIESRLRLIKTPIIFSRSGRSLSDRAFWKATEWRCWLLFYSLPCAADILPTVYRTHFTLLVKAVFALLKNVVLEGEICSAEKFLSLFVQQVAKLYGKNAMTFNIHQLLHLMKATRMFGPLWSTSTFPFEDGISKALQLVSSAKYVPVQIAERCIMHQACRTVSMQIELSPSLISAKKDLESSYRRCSQKCALGLAQSCVHMSENLKCVNRLTGWKKNSGHCDVH
ncbi:hypothetical protein HPB51_012254 [Rhipicephalus microplus]|uniref:Uncharacterized protein n=1 Tax=Rhipicephalus microplus TaxID=6941 RepID=A0A9J6E1U1_RHIMP|nr:hypothetical protein HPB51_012254 [Rhipicephalus microplus]